MPTVAVFDEFLIAYARLARGDQRRVREFARQFALGPTDAELALEPIEGARDGQLRTVRIGTDHRAVVLRTPRDDLSVMLWIDRHVQAVEWARNRTFAVHPSTGALQVFDMEKLSSYLKPMLDAHDTPLARSRNAPLRLFAGTSDSELLAAGVPPVLLPAVKAIRDQAQLAEMGPHLPHEAHEALLRLACGEPPAAARPSTATLPAEASMAALETPDSGRRFALAKSPADLDSILDQPLSRWRLFLHPSQERLAHGHFTGPVRVLGGAGTGKTVAAMHRARYLAREVFTGASDRILLTTYTANLAQNLRDLLAGFCGPELARIDVVHLHAWALHHARAAGLAHEVADDVELRTAWERAMHDTGGRQSRDRGFFEAEWRHVVQPSGIETREQYLAAERPPRAPRLSADERGRVWSVLERFRELLREGDLVDWSELMRSVRKQIAGRASPPLYKAAVVDETQDFGAEELKLVRALVAPGDDDLFLVGDAHQRIYGPRLVLSKLGLDTRGRSFRLRLNYRTTEQIRDWAARLLATCSIDDMEGEEDGHSGYVSLLQGVLPEIRHLPDEEAERRCLAQLLAGLALERPLESVCVVARTRGTLESLVEPALKRARLPYVFLEKQSDKEAGKGIRLATMHRVKGLEFTCVVVAGLSASMVPLIPPWVARLDEAARAEHELRERSLLYVASTRARERLILTASGPLSPFLSGGGMPTR